MNLGVTSVDAAIHIEMFFEIQYSKDTQNIPKNDKNIFSQNFYFTKNFSPKYFFSILLSCQKKIAELS